jgi:hypothetical protein
MSPPLTHQHSVFRVPQALVFPNSGGAYGETVEAGYAVSRPFDPEAMVSINLEHC